MNIILEIIYFAAVIYGWMIVARALLSWFPVRSRSPLFRVREFLVMLTEPYLRIFRRILPTPRVGAVGIDLSALVGLIVLFIVVRVIVRL